MLDPRDIWNHLDQLTKPPRSLGRLEELAARLCEIQQTLRPVTTPRRLLLFAGDHGVVESGVTAWPSDVTSLMIENIRTGGAASTVLAKSTNTQLALIDVGSLREHSNERETADRVVPFFDRRFRRGTRNLHHEAALTPDEFEQARQIGKEFAHKAASDGVAVLACGEMGIGNTTPAACLAMLLANVPLEYAVGRGAGSDDAVLQTKRDVVATAVERARSLFAHDRIAAIASVCGLEIAAMAGCFEGAAEADLTVVLDGYVVTAAALVAEFLSPGTSKRLIASHLSAEPGHRLALTHLKLEPFLEWDLRLGEGTGALLLFPLLDAASAMTTSMATFRDLGIEVESNS